MDLLKTLGAIVLGVLGKKEFSTDESGHLVLTEEEAEKLNGQMKFAGGKFAELFKQSFDKTVDANTGEELAQNELIVNAFIDTIRKDVTNELSINKETMAQELRKEFTEKIANLMNHLCRISMKKRYFLKNGRKC